MPDIDYLTNRLIELKYDIKKNIALANKNKICSATYGYYFLQVDELYDCDTTNKKCTDCVKHVKRQIKKYWKKYDM